MNNHTTTEEWRDITGYEGLYQVSSYGRVRSLSHVIPHGFYKGRTRVSPGKILRQQPNDHGYCAVTLSAQGVHSRREVQRLVGEAFIGPLPDGYHTHHLNENPSDNRLANLEYRTPFDHMHFHNRGEKAHKAVLTLEQVNEIRDLLAQGIIQRVVAQQYGVCRSTIGEIKRGASWAWSHS